MLKYDTLPKYQYELTQKVHECELYLMEIKNSIWLIGKLRNQKHHRILCLQLNEKANENSYLKDDQDVDAKVLKNERLLR